MSESNNTDVKTLDTHTISAPSISVPKKSNPNRTPDRTPNKTPKKSNPNRTPNKTPKNRTPKRRSGNKTPQEPQQTHTKNQPDFTSRHEQILRNLEEDFKETDMYDEIDSNDLRKLHSSESLSSASTLSSNPRRGSIPLNQLIRDLKRKFSKHDSYVANIKRPRLLIQALTELNDMIGMDRLKEAVTLQVMRLIDALNSGQADLGMLNTILYGEPGVGKTNIGIILAKIWHGLGFLENNATTGENWISNMSELSDDQITIITVFGMMALSYMFTGGRLVYNKYGAKGLMIAGVMLIVITGIIVLAWMNRDTDIINNLQLQDSSDLNSNSNSNPNSNPKLQISDSSPDFDRSIIKVVSRKDFVAEYLGQTAPKTKKLLNANIGKVLFIDEAYSLYQNGALGGDMYGAEALTTLNLFLSENPNKIVVIFAGYENLMKDGVFKAQPGLPRRCMWHFQCDGYDGTQLGDIFLLQLKKKGWRVNDVIETKNLISENAKLFPSYGGDTERLIFYAQLAASRNKYHEGGRRNQNMLTSEDIREGLQFLAENNIHKDDNTNENRFDAEELLRRMGGMTQ